MIANTTLLSATQQPIFKLSPSDFAFLWEECRRCFYLKVVRESRRPRTPMPKIFTVIDSRMKSLCNSKRTELIVRGMPGGIFWYGEKWVQSGPILVPGRLSSCIIRGKFDTVVTFDDHTYAVVDFKTGHRADDHLPLYGRQLHAYAYALENAAPGKFTLCPITKLGLLVFEPEAFSNPNGNAVSLGGSIIWIELRRDDCAFMDFLAEVLEVLEQPEPPDAAASCEWCRYHEVA